MIFLDKLKIWYSLQKAKQEEKKHLVTKEELLNSEKVFVKEEKQLNSILKHKKKKRK